MANEWRSACGEASGGEARVAQPQAQAAAHVRGRQAAAALGEEQRRLVRASVRPEPGGPWTGSARARAGPARPPGRCGSWSPCRSRAAPRRRSRGRRRRGSRPPRSAGRTSRSSSSIARSRISSGVRAGMRSSSAVTSSVRSSLGSGSLAGGRGRRGRRGSGTALRVRPCADRTRGSRRTCARPSGRERARPPSRVGAGEVRGVAAQQPVVDVARRGAVRGPAGQLAHVGAVGAARLLGHAAGREASSKRVERRAPGARQLLLFGGIYDLRRMSGFFINVDTGRVATYAKLIEAGEASDREPPGLPWHPFRAQVTLPRPSTRSCENGSRAATATPGSACSVFATETARPLWSAGLGGVTVDEIRAPGSGNLRSTGCRRASGPAPCRTAPRRRVPPSGCSRARRRCPSELIASVPWMPAPS